MPGEHSRRYFLELGAKLTVCYVVAPRDFYKPSKEQVSNNEIIDFCYRIGNIYKHVTEYKLPVSDKILKEWAEIYVPLFTQCGFTNSDSFPSQIVFSDMSEEMLDGENTIAEITSCDFSNVKEIEGIRTGKPAKIIMINELVLDPESWWFAHKASQTWLIHALSHVAQDIQCFAGLDKKSRLESDAQIATAEVLACRAVSEKDDVANKSLIVHLTNMAVDSFRYVALKQQSLMPKYLEFVNTIFTSVQDRKALAIKHQAKTGILECYGYDPLKRILTAFKQNDFVENMLFSNHRSKIGNLVLFLENFFKGVIRDY